MADAEITRKPCITCRESKPLSEFHRDKKGRHGRATRCRDCAKAAASKWYRENKDRASKTQTAWRNQNRGLVRQYSSRCWHSRKNIPSFRLACTVRNAVGKSVRSKREIGAFRHLGFTVEQLCSHIERQFLPGMKWDNYGDWHIDHIVPVASFEITSVECEGFKRAWALTNLRPLWARDNVRKSAKITHLI